jgi:hypothetical protein
MTKQTEAQRLAGLLTASYRNDERIVHAAAAELRRQHAEIESLRAQLAQRVPDEPTREMLDAATILDDCMISHDVRRVAWKQMLSAAPSQQAPGYRLCEFCGCHSHQKHRPAQ